MNAWIIFVFVYAIVYFCLLLHIEIKEIDKKEHFSIKW